MACRRRLLRGRRATGRSRCTWARQGSHCNSSGARRGAQAGCASRERDGCLTSLALGFSRHQRNLGGRRSATKPPWEAHSEPLLGTCEKHLARSDHHINYAMPGSATATGRDPKPEGSKQRRTNRPADCPASHLGCKRRLPDASQRGASRQRVDGFSQDQHMWAREAGAVSFFSLKASCSPPAEAAYRSILRRPGACWRWAWRLPLEAGATPGARAALAPRPRRGGVRGAWRVASR